MLLREPMPKIWTTLFELSVGTKGDLYGYRVVHIFRQYSFPDKKPKNRELSGTQKQENQLFSSSRILIEHLIRRVKVFQIAAQRFRLRPQTYQQVILIVCVPVRLRIGALILPA